MEESYFIGIDIGTQGARVVLMNDKGDQVNAKEKIFLLDDRSREEQSPRLWWSSCYSLLLAMCKEVSGTIDLSKLKAIAATSTSGTVIPLDKNNEPLHDAIMYSDPRSAKEAVYCKEAAIAAGIKGYTAFNSSSGLPKMCWYVNNYPDKVDLVNKFIHATDFITGQLSGNFDVTDYTNALKSGYDLQQLEWPAYITSKLPIRKEWLQDVIKPGSNAGILKKELAMALGLPANVIIAAGMTDGCASQVASGAVNVGDWNTTIGTTLVVKGVTRSEIFDPSGALYCHRHPEGYWMPGGASNTGADWVKGYSKAGISMN